MSDPCQYVISTLEDHNSRLDKEAIILAQAEAKNADLFEGFRLALDPMVTFGIKQIPEHPGPDGKGLSMMVFQELVYELEKRNLTGHDARDAIESIMMMATQSE